MHAAVFLDAEYAIVRLVAVEYLSADPRFNLHDGFSGEMLSVAIMYLALRILAGALS